jgi:hypothetical protein
MNKGMVFLGAIIILFFLTSCTSTGTVVPKAFPGSAEIFQVNDEGTVVVKGYDIKNQTQNWVFIRCKHWSGCYMRCQGPLNKCKSIAEKSDLEVGYIYRD